MSDFILFVYTNEFVELHLSKKYNLKFLTDFEIKFFEDINNYVDDKRLKIAVVPLSEEIYSSNFTLPLIKDLSCADLIIVYSREDVFKDIDTVKKEINDSYNNSNLCVLAGGIDYRTVSSEYFYPLLTQFKLTLEASQNEKYKQLTEREFLFDSLLGTPKPSRKYVYYRLKDDSLINQSLVSMITEQEYYKTAHYNDLWPDITLEYKIKYGDVIPYKSNALEKIDADFYVDNSKIIDVTETCNSFYYAIDDIINNSSNAHPYWKRAFVTPYEIYKNSWYSILCETYQNHRFQPTEKTAKMFLGGRIFVAFCCKHFLKNLKKIGFKTFDNIIDESYDDIEDTKERFDLAWEQVRYLSRSNHLENYKKASDIINHNRSILLDPSFQFKEIEHFIYEHLAKIQR